MPKILLYLQQENLMRKSGVGRALRHQKRAVELMGYEYTTNSKDTDYDVIHINSIFKKSFKMAKKARKAGKKVIYHAHTTVEDIRNSFKFSNLYSKLIKKTLIKRYSFADAIITPTEYSKSLLLNYGIKKPIHVVSNGIDPSLFCKNKQNEEAFLKYFNFNENDKIIMCVGLYFERKGILDFVEIARKFPEYKFVWFGHVPFISVPHKIKKCVKNAPKNCFFPGYIDGEIIRGAYSRSDMFFFPSYEETEGIVVLEACASNSLILLRDINVYKGWMEKNSNCLMGNNNEDFINIIKETMTNSINYQNIKNNTTNILSTKSIEQVSKDLKNVYDSVLK